ncbi:MAG: nucleotidyltransferase domain-containing protein [Chloroflexota bacterium]
MSETFAAYMPHIRQRWLAEQHDWQARRARAWECTQRAVTVLREQFGAHDVIAFGSLVGQGIFDEHSDIDLAVTGIAPQKFFRAWADAARVTDEFELDLVDLADCAPALREKIRAEGAPL